jgi:hypothetical protein
MECWNDGDETGTGYFLFFKKLPVPMTWCVPLSWWSGGSAGNTPSLQSLQLRGGYDGS